MNVVSKTKESGKLCAYCKTKTVDTEWRPFCSERCKLLDLKNWFDGRYRIADETRSPDSVHDSDDGKTW